MDNFTKARDKRKARGDNIVQNMKDAKRFSLGVIVANGVHSLNDNRFLEEFNARQKGFQLTGYQPRSAVALILFFLLPYKSWKICLISGMISVGDIY